MISRAVIRTTFSGRAAALALLTAAAIVAVPARADPHICVGGMTDIELLFHVKQDAYFRENPGAGKALRIEYDGCGYRIHVDEKSRDRHSGDLLLVDRYGHVTRVVRRR